MNHLPTTLPTLKQTQLSRAAFLTPAARRKSTPAATAACQPDEIEPLVTPWPTSTKQAAKSKVTSEQRILAYQENMCAPLGTHVLHVPGDGSCGLWAFLIAFFITVPGKVGGLPIREIENRLCSTVF